MCVYYNHTPILGLWLVSMWTYPDTISHSDNIECHPHDTHQTNMLITGISRDDNGNTIIPTLYGQVSHSSATFVLFA